VLTLFVLSLKSIKVERNLCNLSSCIRECKLLIKVLSLCQSITLFPSHLDIILGR